MIDRLALPFYPPATNNMSRGNWHWDALKKQFTADLAALTAGLPLLRIPAPQDAFVSVVMADGKADVDGRLKSLLDGLQAIGIFDDDKQVVSLIVHKVPRVAMDQRILVRWGPQMHWTTDAIEGWFGAPVKAPKVRRAKKGAAPAATRTDQAVGQKPSEAPVRAEEAT